MLTEKREHLEDRVNLFTKADIRQIEKIRDLGEKLHKMTNNAKCLENSKEELESQVNKVQ